MRRRLLTVLLAVALAVLGIVAVLAYVHNADQRALTGLKPVKVLVATQSIPAGTNAEAALRAHQLAYRQYPANALPGDAVSLITRANSRLVTSSPLQQGQLLVQSMLVQRSQGVTSLGIPAGMMAVTVQVCLSADVAGYIQPGAWVAVFNTGDTQSPLQYSCTSHEPPTKGTVDTYVVLPRVEVLSVVPAPSAAQATSSSSTPVSGIASGVASAGVVSQGLVLVTFAASQDTAAKLINVNNSGEPTLALLTPSTSVTTTGAASSQPSGK